MYGSEVQRLKLLIMFPLLASTNCDYIFRLYLAIFKSIPDIFQLPNIRYRTGNHLNQRQQKHLFFFRNLKLNIPLAG